LLVDEEVGKNRDRKSAKSRQRKKIDRLVGRSVGQSNRSVGQSGVFISLKQKLSEVRRMEEAEDRKSSRIIANIPQVKTTLLQVCDMFALVVNSTQ
jgi:hypothetical protein